MEDKQVNEAIQRLQNFYDRLQLYSSWIDRLRAEPTLAFQDHIGDKLGSGTDCVSAEQFVLSLVREAGGMKSVVRALIGTKVIVQFGISYDPWLEAFSSPGNPRLRHSIGAVLRDVNEAIGKLESRELISKLTQSFQPNSIRRPKVFIAHDGEGELRNRLETECWRMMLEPIIAEEETSLNESVDKKVNRVLGQCEFAIVLARSERGIKQDGVLIPRGNVIDEIGRIRNELGDHYVILLEKGLSLPSNLSTGVVYETFEKEHFENAVLKLVKSLRHFHIL